jgi:hypothetical protein
MYYVNFRNLRGNNCGRSENRRNKTETGVEKLRSGKISNMFLNLLSSSIYNNKKFVKFNILRLKLKMYLLLH